MTDSPLRIERDGAVAILTLDRPTSRNSLNRELSLALGAALRDVAGDPSVRAVVLTGAGDGFCSGADLKAGVTEIGAAPLDQRVDEFHAMIRGIVEAPQPFVAAVHGGAVGFGADLALACDLRILSTAGYLQEKFVKIGLMPDGGGTFWMPRLVGLGRAMEYLMLGTRLDAPLALELGLASRVVAPAELREAALAVARELASNAPLALTAIKRAVRASLDGGLDAALEREKQGQLRLLASEDLVEGVLAWSQRRPPTFHGR
ncbi:MAG: enoyl-CoA hydratase/isomerase family protein [Polyangiaceae bacterium]|nr:enoyl-CoA hydratase/isomerase family protein [Polyangiaceae bacterium]